MKVLFAVSSENISEAIIKRYQKEYKEILSYKNVYYFNAILKEIQKDKTYDRIIISEDLEPFSNNNYDTIDKFIFEKLDSISDEGILNSKSTRLFGEKFFIPFTEEESINLAFKSGEPKIFIVNNINGAINELCLNEAWLIYLIIFEIYFLLFNYF